MNRRQVASQSGLSPLSIAASALLLVPFTGCLRQTPSTFSGAYRIVKFSDVSVLTPPGLVRTTGNSQETLISFKAKSSTATPPTGVKCFIDGQHFSLYPASDNQWRIKSPTPEAWNSTEVQTSGEGEWLTFTNRIAALASQGCFPLGMNSYSVQRRIVEAIPIPADRALRFYYSLTAAGFVDLQPGMQLRIETIQSQGGKAATYTTQLSVVGRTPTGVALELQSKNKASEAGTYSNLWENLHEEPFLRLFLEQAATETEHARKAILVGAHTSKEIDLETEALVQAKGTGCPNRGFTATCTEFRNGTVSLLTSITVNGRVHLYAPGTTLSQVVDAVPEPHRASALASVSLVRKEGTVSVPVLFPRTEEDLVNVLLINGDRIHWHV